MATAAAKLLETTKSALKGECTHQFSHEGPQCPCCDHVVKVHAGTSNIRLLHGQRIYLCCEDCKFQFASDPSSYLVTEGEHAARKSKNDWLDQKDYEHFRIWCPGCNSSLHVNDTTPRVHLINGQTLFFRCYECVVDFLAKPERVFANCGNLWAPKLQAEQAQAQEALKEQGQQEHDKAKQEKKHCEEWTEEKLDFCQRKHHHSFKPTEKFIKEERSGKALCAGCANQICFSTHADFFVEFMGGQRIFFCCESCMNGFPENPMQALKSAKSFRHKEEEFLNLEGMIMACPTCENRKIPLTTATPRIYFEHGQSLFFDKYSCLETFCSSASKYVHSCPGLHKAHQQTSIESQEQGKEKLQVIAPSSHAQMPLSKEDVSSFQHPHSTTQKVPLEQPQQKTGQERARG